MPHHSARNTNNTSNYSRPGKKGHNWGNAHDAVLVCCMRASASDLTRISHRIQSPWMKIILCCYDVILY